MNEDGRRPCVLCAASLPAGVGVCTHCGCALPMMNSAGDYTVLVEDIAGARQREEVVQLAEQWLDGVNTAGLRDKLAKSRVRLASHLDREEAECMLEALKRRQVAASIVEGPIRPTTVEAMKRPRNWGFLLAGLLVDLLVGGVLTLGVVPFGTLTGLVVFAVLVGASLTVGTREPPVGQPRLAYGELSGFEDHRKVIGQLLRELNEEERGSLSEVLTDIAEMQADLESESLSSFAFGGSEGTFGRGIRHLLEQALSHGETALTGRSTGNQSLSQLATRSAALREAYSAVRDATQGDDQEIIKQAVARANDLSSAESQSATGQREGEQHANIEAELEEVEAHRTPAKTH